MNQSFLGDCSLPPPSHAAIQKEEILRIVSINNLTINIYKMPAKAPWQDGLT